MTKTEHYQLNQWDANDPVRREDFNADNAAIDAALSVIRSEAAAERNVLNRALTALAAEVGNGGRNARIAWGTYTGTGTFGAGTPKTFSCTFLPVLLIVSTTSQYEGHHMTLVRGSSMTLGTYSNDAITVSWETEAVKCASTIAPEIQMNQAGTQYCYVIFGYDNEL